MLKINNNNILRFSFVLHFPVSNYFPIGSWVRLDSESTHRTPRRRSCIASFVLLATAAIKIDEAGLLLPVGRSRCRVKELGKRRPTCYRCQDHGLGAAERINLARQRRWYRCKGEGNLNRRRRRPPIDVVGNRPRTKHRTLFFRSWGQLVSLGPAAARKRMYCINNVSPPRPQSETRY